jgi:hypothetical protein
VSNTEQARPAFGARVRVTATLRRRTIDTHTPRRAWKPWPLSAAREGLYIGRRTLYDGKVIYEEYGIEFHPESHFTAALVVFSERERPVLVPFDALEVVQP